MKKLVVLAVMLPVLLTACGEASKCGDTAAMPASSSHLEGEAYQDVVTSYGPPASPMSRQPLSMT